MARFDQDSIRRFRERHPRMRCLVTERYGRLLVTAYSHTREKNGQPFYDCRCDCGETKTIAHSSLKGGLTKSCGCFRKENTAEMRRSFAMRRPVIIKPADVVVSLVRHLD